MKRLSANMKTITAVVTSLVMVVIALNFGGCANEYSPLTPVNNDTAVSSQLNFLKFSNNPYSLKKVISVSQWVTKKDGGELVLEYKGEENNNGKVYVKITLKVPENSIKNDTELFLSLDDQDLIGNVDLTFGPHGTKFSKPAILTIEAKALDLSGLKPWDLDIYYDDQNAKKWKKMNSEEIIVKIDEGYVKVIEAQLPHFSRYAIATE